jgi:hypothetical protein
MNFVRVVKGGTVGNLEEKINAVLEENVESTLVDIKIGSAYNGNSSVTTAVIVFERA